MFGQWTLLKSQQNVVSIYGPPSYDPGTLPLRHSAIQSARMKTIYIKSVFLNSGQFYLNCNTDHTIQDLNITKMLYKCEHCDYASDQSSCELAINVTRRFKRRDRLSQGSMYMLSFCKVFTEFLQDFSLIIQEVLTTCIFPALMVTSLLHSSFIL